MKYLVNFVRFRWLFVPCVLSSFTSFAQESGSTNEEIEQILVTGSYIKGGAEDAALPIDVLSREDLDNSGSPNMIEMVRNLGVATGNIGESNSYQNGPVEGVTTINLRGLGSARTLVLLNGQRQVATETLGVDISALPSAALGRIEILKDGAAALYGSDAIGGVVNFITRSYFEGFEFRASNQFIQDSDGEQNLAAIYGIQSDKFDFIIAAEYEQRNELKVADRDWALRPLSENPEGGWSSIGNPGRIFPAYDLGAGPQAIGAGGADPQCELLGGTVSGYDCSFQFLAFNNLIEKQQTSKLFSEFNWDVNNNIKFHLEGLLAFMKVPQVASSPTFPPNSLFGPDRYVDATHPGLIDFKAQHPELFPLALGAIPGEIQGAFTSTRLLGVVGRNGGASLGSRDSRTSRIAAGLIGSLANDAIDFDIGMSWSQRIRVTRGEDSFIERTAFALDGLGGENCDQATGTPGVEACEYYNPFSNAIEVSAANGAINPEYNPDVANSPELMEWLIAKSPIRSKNWLATVHSIFNGSTDIDLGGGDIKWAAGAQIRRERYQHQVPDILEQSITPCPFNDPMSVTLGNVATLDCPVPTGQLAFLAAAEDESTIRNIYSVFSEFAIPVTNTLELQAAIRYEDYGGITGSSIDPKLAASWTLTDWLKLRGSASTTFRGPPQSYLAGTDTSLGFITAALAFKAVDVKSNPNLKAETAVATNLGFIIDTGAFRASLDWYRFDISDPFQTESATNVLEQYTALGCEAGGAGDGTADCEILRTHVFPYATTAASLERLEVNIINGNKQKGSGLDLAINYSIKDVLGGNLSLGLQGTKILAFESDDFKDINGLLLSEGGDYAGLLNDGDPFTSLPEVKATFNVGLSLDDQHFSYVLRYVSSYDDVRPALPSLAVIDSQITHNVNYNFTVFEDVKLSLSITNLTDEDPPIASTNLNYDPYTHNAFGRMVKIGLIYRL